MFAFFVCLFVSLFFQKCRIIIIYNFRREKKNKYERMRGEGERKKEKVREGDRREGEGERKKEKREKEREGERKKKERNLK